MAQPTIHNRIVTPEAVALDLDLAGLGSRMIALIIDSLIQGGVLLLVFLAVFEAHPGTGVVIVFFVLGFVTWFGYFPLFEGLWHGQTPGKRAQKLRVIQADGQPVTWAAVLIRNLLRIVDILPSMYAVGVVTMVMTRRSQRVGDLAASTIVVRERRVAAPAPLPLPPAPGVASPATSTIDVSALSAHDHGLIRSFLERRAGLEAGVRAGLATQIANAVRPRVSGMPPPSSDEDFLELVARAYRERFAGTAG